MVLPRRQMVLPRRQKVPFFIFLNQDPACGGHVSKSIGTCCRRVHHSFADVFTTDCHGEKVYKKFGTFCRRGADVVEPFGTVWNLLVPHTVKNNCLT